MAFECVTTCSNLVTISQTEYTFLSHQSAMSVRSTLRTFKQPLKYLCFSHSLLDGVRKYVQILETPSWKT